MKYSRLFFILFLISGCSSNALKSSINEYFEKLTVLAEKITSYPYKATFHYIQDTISTTPDSLYKDSYKITILSQPDDIIPLAKKFSSFCTNISNCTIISMITTNPIKGIDPASSIKISTTSPKTILDKINSISGTLTSISYTNYNSTHEHTLITLEIKRNYYSNLSYFKNLFYTFANYLYIFGFIPAILIAILIPWYILLYSVNLLITLFKREK